MKQEHQVGSLNNCIAELQQQACAQRLELEDAQHGYFESRREQVRLQEELSMKEKFLRDTQIRSMHEMGEIKRAQELRVDQFSVQKLREKSWNDTEAHFTIAVCARTHEFYERYSGAFQGMESNPCGRFSHVPSQPEVIPSSSSSVLCRDKRLPFEIWNSLGLRENVFGKQFSTFGSPGNHSQGIMVSHTKHQERQNQFHKQLEKDLFRKRWRAK